MRVNSAILALSKLLGHNFADSSKKFPMAGRNRTGNGRTKRVNADSNMALRPAALERP